MRAIKKVTNAISSNFRTKLLALVIALGIWFYASSQLTERNVIPVQLELKPPPGYTMVYTSHRQVDVTVSGPASAWEALQRSARVRPPRIQHQLSAAVVGTPGEESRLDEVSVNLKPEWIDFRIERWQSDRLRVLRIAPQEITVVAEPVVEELISVDVRTPLSLELQGALDWTPDQVTVKGPAAVVRNLDSIGLAEDQTLYDIGRNARKKALERRVTVSLNGERIPIEIETEPRRVDVMLADREPESEQEATFADVPIRLLVPAGFPFAVQVAEDQPASVDVHVRAMPETLNRLRRSIEADPTALVAYVDLGNLPAEVKPGETYKELVRARLPNDMTASEISVPDPENPNVTLELTIVLRERTLITP